MSETFGGFSPGKTAWISIPAQFFSDLLPLIDDLGELHLTLFCWRALMQKEGDYRYLIYEDFANDAALMRGLALAYPDTDPVDRLTLALGKAKGRGTLLTVDVALDAGDKRLYFVNTAKGRAAVRQINAGAWMPTDDAPVEILPERPNTFTLYEENIGPLTPMIAEAIRDAEREFPAAWLPEAVQIAVENNKRSWRYIHAILDRWKREGKSDYAFPERTGEETQGEYQSGDWDDFIKS